MGQVLHPNAVTTHATRKAIQEASAKVSTYALAKQYGLRGCLKKIDKIAFSSVLGLVSLYGSGKSGGFEQNLV